MSIIWKNGSGRSRRLTYTTSSSMLRGVQAGSEDAWRAFYQKYAKMIRFIGQKQGLDTHECDDLMIDVMTVFWKKMDLFIYDRERGKFRSYLGRIANFCAMRRFTKKQMTQAVPAEGTLEYPPEIDVSIMTEWQDFILQQALSELKEQVDTETYQVFYMSFIQKCSVEKISAVTRKTPNNIYVIRSRCLARLTRLIRKYRQLDEAMLSAHSHKNK